MTGASVLFDLPGYRVLDAVDTGDSGRPVTIASTALEGLFTDEGVVAV